MLGQIIEAMDQSSDIKNYKLKDREVKYFHPKCNNETGKFLGIYETIGFLVVRGDPFEDFLNYGYDKERSKVLYSTFRKKIPNSFSGTMFNRHKILAECGEIDKEMSEMFFYLPYITNRSEEINQYLENVSISHFDINQQRLDIWAGNTPVRPEKLDFAELKSEKMKAAVVKALERITGVSKSNLVRNADGLLCRKKSTAEVKWVADVKRGISEKYKISY